MDHNYELFGDRSRGLRIHYTWLRTHPLGYARRFITDKEATLVWWDLDRGPHPLGNINQFHGLLPDPKVPSLT